MQPTHFFLGAAITVTVVASVYDLRSGRIPNWLSLGVLAAAPVAHFAWAAARGGGHAGVVELEWSLAGAALCAFIPFLGWRTGSFGGGDLKLLAGVGALCLPTNGMLIQYYATIVGALFVMGRLAWRGSLLRTLGAVGALAINPFLPKSRRRPVPVETMTSLRFAPAILAGTLVVTLAQAR